jgi:chromosome partitioning protein
LRKLSTALRNSKSRVTVCMRAGLRYEPVGSDSRLPEAEEAAITVSAPGPHRIVFANEKGGTGKSTTAVHVAVALAYQGARVAALDLDPRQRTLYRYFENRADTEHRRGIELPGARFDVFEGGSIEEMEAAVTALAEQAGDLSGGCDFVIFDTPGRDDALARHAATQADTLVTPMNDSFVDFDLIGQVDAETFKVRRLSF